METVIFLTKKDMFKCLRLSNLKRCVLCKIVQDMSGFGTWKKTYRCTACRKLKDHERHEKAKQREVKKASKAMVEMKSDLFVEFD